jgi:serine/threonine protein kinase
MSFKNLVDTTLGQYKLVQYLGKGGMGVVYRAMQPRLNRSVAIKILAESQAGRVDQVRRFHREAETSAKLEHPNIVPIYDYGTEEDMNYVVMRLLGGGSLADHIDSVAAGREEQRSIQEVGELLQQIASALDYAHNQGVIHRDVKPSNVMFDNYQNAFLVDFGLVKLIDTSSSHLTGAGIILGTPAYMAPEQWRDENLSPGLDQYALAIVTYQLLSGRLPFDADTSPYELMHQHCEVQPPDIHEIKQDLPAQISAVLQKAMSKDPADRYAKVMDFAEAFMEAANHQQITSMDVGRLGDVEDEVSTMKPENKKVTKFGVLRIHSSRDAAMVGTEVRVEGDTFTIGRLKRDLNFNGDRNVSRNHAHITHDKSTGQFFLIDQDSTLKTVVDGVEVQPFVPCELGDSADIRLGTTTIMTFYIRP